MTKQDSIVADIRRVRQADADSFASAIPQAAFRTDKRKWPDATSKSERNERQTDGWAVDRPVGRIAEFPYPLPTFVPSESMQSGNMSCGSTK